eukprot:jgi/Ulvmu1/1421/UM011_0150.1
MVKEIGNRNTMVTMMDGQYTSTVYSLIKDGRFSEAMGCLETVLEILPSNRAALSLLGYCYYHYGHYESACQAYEALVRYHGEHPEYRLYHAQTLFKMGDLVEASRVADVVNGFDEQVMHLKLAIAYASEQIPECKRILRGCKPRTAEVLRNEGCILYMEGSYMKACKKFEAAVDVIGHLPHLQYSIALCHFKQQDLVQALKCLATVIEEGVKQHPELSVGSQCDGQRVHSVGNSQALQDSALVEAFNLKCAIEYQLGNEDGAAEALVDMPPREVQELDPCTLHNKALVTFSADPEEGFRTMNFLIGNPPFPHEAFANLLLLYMKPPHNLLDFAADTIAQYPDYVQQYLPRDLLMFIDAMTMRQSSPSDAFQQFERIARQYVEKLRLLSKLVQDARVSSPALLPQKMQEYDAELQKYIPVLMAEAHMFWEIGQYSNAQAVLLQSKEFAGEHQAWKLNMAHTHFMMDVPVGKGDESTRSNFQKAIDFYHPILHRHKEEGTLLSTTAMVVANLCVSYIMDEKNREAEELMKQVEEEEERCQEQDNNKQVLHSCIINLVIGTLYCAKQNYEFGISRVIKSLQPLERKLETDTWFYAKRCFVAIADGLAKHTVFLNDKTVMDILEFLESVHAAGKEMPATLSLLDKSHRTIASEANQIYTVVAKHHNI